VGARPDAAWHTVSRPDRDFDIFARRLVGALGVDVGPSKGRVLVMRPDGGGRRTVTQIEGAAIGDVAWSPDGRWLAFVARVVPQD
jgi:Tol biopolymer transport system component